MKEKRIGGHKAKLARPTYPATLVVARPPNILFLIGEVSRYEHPIGIEKLCLDILWRARRHRWRRQIGWAIARRIVVRFTEIARCCGCVRRFRRHSATRGWLACRHKNRRQHPSQHRTESARGDSSRFHPDDRRHNPEQLSHDVSIGCQAIRCQRPSPKTVPGQAKRLERLNRCESCLGFRMLRLVDIIYIIGA